MDRVSSGDVDPSAAGGVPEARAADSGLSALVAIAGFYRIASRPETLAREYALTGAAGADDILRAASSIGLKARKVVAQSSSGGSKPV